MNYLIWTNLYLTFFYGFYWVFLRNETFFNLNRWYFLGAAILSFLLPLIDVGSVGVAAQSQLFVSELPVLEIGSMAASPSFPVWLSIYLAGCAVSLVWLIYRFISIYSSFKNPPSGAAYSFLTAIYIDNSLAARDTMLAHEKVHVEQLHSVDIVFFELIRTFLWFNPVVHVWIRAAKLNHEYIADRATTVDHEDRIQYATLLVQQNLGVPINTLANNFFNKPFLKKRIAMLFKNQSKQSVAARLLLLIPVIMISFAFQSAEQAEPNFRSEVPISETYPLKQDSIFKKPDVMPKFAGGMDNLYRFIGKNYSYPPEAQKANVQGRLLYSFVVEKDGSLVDIKLVQDIGHGTGEEGLRVLKSSPKWEPGLVNGKPVRVQFTLPIQLNLAPADKTPEDKPNES